MMQRAGGQTERDSMPAVLQRLLANQSHMLAALDAHAILSITDAAGTIIRINSLFCLISGYAEEELLGRNHRLLKSGVHDEHFYHAMWSTISAGQSWQGEICNRRKDGSLYWVESTITPVCDEGGTVHGYISLRTDITRTKTHELILQNLAAISAVDDTEFPAAAAAWLAGSLQVRLAFISVVDAEQPGQLQPLALWDRSAPQPLRPHPIADDPCGAALREGMVLQMAGLQAAYPSAGISTAADLESCLVLAFRDRSGKALGVLGIMDDKPLRDWRDKHEWLSILAPRLEHMLQRERFRLELQRSEAQYRTLTQNIPGMVYRTTADWALEFVSGAEAVCGLPEQQLQGSRGCWHTLVHPEDQRALLQVAYELEAESCARVQQYRIRHVDGGWRWVSDHKRSMHDAQGRFLGVDGVLFDISVHKQIEVTNALDKERLTRSQRYANIGTWDWSIGTGEFYWTDRIPVLLGHAEGSLEATYDNFLAAVHPEDREAVVAGMACCIWEHQPFEVEHRVVWPDGTVRWLLERGDVIRDAAGSPLHMLGVVQDIDDRKRAELALAEREAQLHEAQALAHIGNWHADLRSGEVYWSEEVQRIFGHDPATYVPNVPEFRAAVHPEDRKLQLEAEAQAAVNGVLDVVHRIVRPDGSVRHVHALGKVVADEAGNIVKMVGTLQDVTQQVRSQQALIKAREEAERANRAKTEFLSSMSHELRTPMNAILGFSQLLETDERLDPALREGIIEIRKAGNHLLYLINEVLDLARIESGQLVLSCEAVRLSEAVQDCIALVQPLADAREISIRLELLEGALVIADPVRLRQVLLNLLSNAVKYNRDGGSIVIAVAPGSDGRLQLQVRDTGLGIPAVSQQRVFEAFTRLHEDKVSADGSGIGLAITRRLVERMGGSIGFDSREGEGSCFRVELPRAAADSWTLPEPVLPEPVPASPGADSDRSHTLLLVDDNPANLRLVARILERVPRINLLTACSGSLGLELARAYQPDLVLLDINMPDMDGYSLLRQLQEDVLLCHTPVFALTANALPGDVERGRAAGFADYLTKPLDISSFIQRICRQLGLE
jgi:PAS domain S-box-containing protein